MTDKVFSIGDSLAAKNIMTEEQRRALEILDRGEKEKEDLSATSLVLDNSNEISFPGYPYIFEGLGEKILVSIDVFKSGYECKVCKGKRRIETRCSCQAEGHEGKRYSAEEIKSIRETLGDGIADAREAQLCPSCDGDFVAFQKNETCPSCQGRGAILILPDESKNLPTTGVVVSMGEATTPTARAILNKIPLNYKVGDRILFGPYSGNMIPTKAGILFKIMDADAAWCKIKGANDLGQFDFILQDSE